MRRILILSVSLVAAVASWRDASLAYWRNQALLSYSEGRPPQGMPQWAASDPEIAVTAGQARLAGPALSGREAEAIAGNARAALASGPLNPAALYQLGAVSEQSRPGTGLPFFELTERLSRREVPNELQLERRAAERGDLPGALSRVDHIVSVAPSLAGTVFPPMVPALADPAIRAAFTRYASRPWFASLLTAAVDGGGDPDAIAAMTAAASGSLAPEVVDDIGARLMSRLLAGGDFDAARRQLARLSRARREGLSGIDFNPVTLDPRLAPLSWSLASDATASAQSTPARALTVSVGAEKSAQVATRTTLLPAGQYELLQTLAYDAGTPPASLIWDVTCGGAAPAALWHQLIPFRGGARVTYRAAITVPPECGAQVWRLQAVGGAGDVASSVTLSGLRLGRR
jgi:hypothetical protein